MEKSFIINWSAKMDNRSNSEVVNLTPNENGIVFEYLENGDLFYSKALTNRKGIQDLCNGIVNIGFSGVPVINTITGVNVAGSTTGWTTLSKINSSLLDYPTTIFIPTENIALTSGNVFIRDVETIAQYTALAPEQYYEMILRADLFELNQRPARALGPTWFSGVNIVNTGLYNIALTGNWYTIGAGSASPIYVSQEAPVPDAGIQESVGFGKFNFRSFLFNSSNSTFYSDEPKVTFNFTPPAYLNSGSVYAIRWNWMNTSGTKDRNLQIKTITNTGVDLSPNSVLAQEYFNSNTSQFYAQRFMPGTTDKTWIFGDLSRYATTLVLNPDLYTGDTEIVTPFVSGSLGGGVSPGASPYSNTTNLTTSAPVGQIINLTGLDTYYGAYFWAGLNRNPYFTLYNKKTSTDTVMAGPQNIGISTILYKVTANSGFYQNGNYQAYEKELIASGNGNYVFDYNNGTNKNLNGQGIAQVLQVPSYNLNKVYTMFDKPVSIQGSGLKYIITFSLFNYDTGEPYADYADYAFSMGPSIGHLYYPAMMVGTETPPAPDYQGAFVFDYFNNGVFSQPSGVYGTDTSNYFTLNPNFDLSCGLITIPTGNWINGIYDYRVGEDRSSKIVYGQSNQMRYFDLDFPDKSNHVVINTGLSPKENALLSFATYDDLMFAHQYSEVSGVCWNQVYPSTMLHGKRPTTQYGFQTGVGGGIPTGVPFNLMVANNFSTGGFRTLEYKNLRFSGVIGNPSGYLALSGFNGQYPFDVPTGGSIYFFVTAASGTNYYLANIYSGNNTSSTLLNYPLNSGLTSGFLQRLANPNEDIAFSQVTNLNQSYATTQVDTPKFKKIEVFYDYLIGIGDPNFPSRLWYSEQFAPQIWGESFDFHGFVDIDKDSGSPITSIVKLRDFIIVFKKNSCYKVEYTGNNSSPFFISPISSKIGSIGSFNTITIGDTVYGLSQYGVFATQGVTIQTISDVIEPFFQSLDHENLTFAYAVHDQSEDKIIWSINDNPASPDVNKGIIFNYKEGSFSVREGGMWNVAATVFNDDGFDVLLGGTNNGQINVLEVGNVENDVLFDDGNGAEATRAVQLYAETPWLSVGDSQINKQYRFISFNADQASATLAVEVYLNQSDELRYIRYVNLNTKSSDKRINLGQYGKTIKFKFYNVGNPGTIKIKNMNLYYNTVGNYRAF